MPEQMEVLAMAKMLSMVLVTYKSKQELKNEMWKLRQFGNHCKKYVELEKLGQFAIVNVKSFARFLVITVQTADNQVRIVYCAWYPYYKPNTTIEHICSNKNSTTFFHVTN